MYCPEHLVFKAFGDRVYLWMYWRDVPREKIPLRVWLNPLRYELSIHVSTRRSRVVTINRSGHWARTVPAAIRRIWPA